jgi:hypothetical protein
MSGEPDSVRPLMAPLFSAIILSNLDLTLLAISTLHTQYFGEGSFYYCFGIHRFRLLKISHPLRCCLVRKRV